MVVVMAGSDKFDNELTYWIWANRAAKLTLAK
jgi:hypothetical protein